MGKKRTRSSSTSKGERRSVAAGVKEVRASRTPLDKALNKQAAWKAGKNPWVTVPGPSTSMAWIKVRANSVYGDPRYAMANMYKNKGEE